MTQYPLELPTLPGPRLQVQAARVAVRLVVAVRLAAEAQAQQPLQAQARGVSLRSEIRPIRPAARPERLPERNAGGRQMPSSRVSRVRGFLRLPVHAQ